MLVHNELLKYILKELEISPNRTFQISELKSISSSDFDRLLKGKLLKYYPYEPEGDNYSCTDGCSSCDSGYMRRVARINKKWEAVCTDTEADTKSIPLSEDDIIKYSFDIRQFIEIIRKENNLGGNCEVLHNRLYFIGTKEGNKPSYRRGRQTIALILAFLDNSKTAESLLLSIPQRLPEYGVTILLSPFFSAVPSNLLKILQDNKVYFSQFKDAFGDSGLIINQAIYPKITIPESEKKLVKGILTPAGTEWIGIIITMESNYEYCRIAWNKGSPKRYRYDRLGFENKRATKEKKQNRLWGILMQFAENYGQLGWQRGGFIKRTKATAETQDGLETESFSDNGDEQNKSVTIRRPKDFKAIGKMKTDIKELRDVLQAIFPGISGDPIYEENGIYKTRFNIEPE